MFEFDFTAPAPTVAATFNGRPCEVPVGDLSLGQACDRILELQARVARGEEVADEIAREGAELARAAFGEEDPRVTSTAYAFAVAMAVRQVLESPQAVEALGAYYRAVGCPVAAATDDE